MQIVAKKNSAYLVQMTEDLGRIYDPTMNRIYDPFSMKEILETGDWEPIAEGEEVPDIDMLVETGAVEQIGTQQRGPRLTIDESGQRDEFSINVPQ